MKVWGIYFVLLVWRIQVSTGGPMDKLFTRQVLEKSEDPGLNKTVTECPRKDNITWMKDDRFKKTLFDVLGWDMLKEKLLGSSLKEYHNDKPGNDSRNMLNNTIQSNGTCEKDGKKSISKVDEKDQSRGSHEQILNKCKKRSKKSRMKRPKSMNQSDGFIARSRTITFVPIILPADKYMETQIEKPWYLKPKAPKHRNVKTHYVCQPSEKEICKFKVKSSDSILGELIDDLVKDESKDILITCTEELFVEPKVEPSKCGWSCARRNSRPSHDNTCSHRIRIEDCRCDLGSKIIDSVSDFLNSYGLR